VKGLIIDLIVCYGQYQVPPNLLGPPKVYSQPPVTDGTAHVYAKQAIATDERRNQNCHTIETESTTSL
jgi:hypothetical protein